MKSRPAFHNFKGINNGDSVQIPRIKKNIISNNIILLNDDNLNGTTIIICKPSLSVEVNNCVLVC